MKNYLKNGGLVLGGSVAAVSTASAAVPVAITTALTDAGTDGATIAGAVLLVIIGIATFKYIRRAV